jgi:hypothetical protein
MKDVTMIKAMIIGLTLFANTQFANSEKARLSSVLEAQALSHSSSLSALAEHQAKAIVKTKTVANVDEQGRDFSEQAKLFKFNNNRTKLYEICYMGNKPDLQLNLDEFFKTASVQRFTHYGVATFFDGEAYIIVITIGNFGVYV